MAYEQERSSSVSRERRLGQRLHAFSNMVSGHYFQRTEKPFGIPLAEWRVLRSTIISPNISQSEIAVNEGLNVMNVSRAVASLRRKGLVSAESDPADRRRTLLAPTSFGLEVASDIGVREHLMYEHLFGGLTDDELATLDDLMSRVNGLLRAANFPEPPEPKRPWGDVIADALQE